MTDVTMPAWAGETPDDTNSIERPRRVGRARLDGLRQNVRDGWRLVREGQAATVAHAVRARLRSDTLAVGLRRDLTRLHAAPPAAIPLVVRPLRPDDDLSFLDAVAGLPLEAARTRAAQRRLVAAELPTCWVAVAPDGRPCYIQWLLLPRDNGRIHARWGDLFPALAPDEALLEGAYTAESHRGQGVMAHAMARIAEEARCLGARWVVTFVGADNVASLKGCRKAGFSPYVERRESWRLFRRRVRCTPLP